MLAGCDLVKCRFCRVQERQIVAAFENEHCFGVGITQMIGDLARRKQHADRDDRRPGLHDSVIDDREIG